MPEPETYALRGNDTDDNAIDNDEYPLKTYNWHGWMEPAGR